MPTERHFVGRQAELDRFRQLLDDPSPHAVLITGGQGMGKSFLARKMVEVAEDHPALQCGAVRYEVARSDSVDSVMALMLDHAFSAALGVEGSFAPTEHRRKQWRTLFETVLPKGTELMALIASLRRDLQRSPREQLIEALHALSERVPEDRRVLFLIDAEKEMPPGSDQAWVAIVRSLPPRVVLLFPQRPDDQLAASDEFRRPENLVCIPAEPLGRLTEPEVDDLLGVFGGALPQDPETLRDHLRRLDGHPYAVAATLDLLEQGIALEELPLDPGGIAGEQWKKVLAEGEGAQRLFEAHALLEVPVPYEVAIAVAGIDRRAHTRLLANPYVNGLLLQQETGRRIYHSLLANRILADLPIAETEVLHRAAVAVYSQRLNRDAKPDELSATRLPVHGERAGASEILVKAGLTCLRALSHLGFVKEALALAERLKPSVEKDSDLEADLLNKMGFLYRQLGSLEQSEQVLRRSLEIEERLGRHDRVADVVGSLGLIYRVRGDLDQAEQMQRRSLELNERLGRQKGMANAYGNLGVIYQMRGDLDQAEQMLQRSLEIHKRLGRQEGMANAYGSLGMIYKVRRELDQAEQMLQRSLEIHERLGLLEGMANAYGNLGVIYQIRGDLDQAEQMLQHSLEIHERLGRQEGMAVAYTNLSRLYRARGDLRPAEQMLQRSLGINERLGQQEGMAHVYVNLGRSYRVRGELKQAEQMLRRSLEISRRIGAQPLIEYAEGLLADLHLPPEGTE